MVCSLCTGIRLAPPLTPGLTRRFRGLVTACPRPLYSSQNPFSTRPSSVPAQSTKIPRHASRGFSPAQRRLAAHLTTKAHAVGAQAMEPQRVDAPLTQSATFLVLTVADTPEAFRTVRSAVASVDDLAKNVAIRDLNAQFACTVGIGSNVWDRVTGLPRPAELHPFPEVKGNVHTAVSTPGDLLFHIRSERRDLCFEFERQLLEVLGSSVSVVDVTVGFRYFDLRDLLGFVDGTANPVGPAVPASVLVAEEDSAAVGGSYIVIQKYVHDMKGWGTLSTEQQESIIGRRKWDNFELADAASDKQKSHKSLATIEDEDGTEREILRDNMPFGSPGSGEFGTYFIGYSRRLWVIERMLERMFIGNPPGLHDRLLNYSTPLTGSTFFAPSASLLASIETEDE